MPSEKSQPMTLASGSSRRRRVVRRPVPHPTSSTRAAGASRSAAATASWTGRYISHCTTGWSYTCDHASKNQLAGPGFGIRSPARARFRACGRVELFRRAGWLGAIRADRLGHMAEQNETEQLKMDATTLYREDVYTDRRIGMIRKLTPVTSAGADDPARPVIFTGQAQIVTPAGVLPITFEI